VALGRCGSGCPLARSQSAGIEVSREGGDKGVSEWCVNFSQEVSLVNPKIVEKSEATDVEEEACLSFPDMQGKVRRHKWIKVR